ncbi:MAG TPA: DUF4388 domain-containing protein [Thermoanaerobaculia bacterium]|jgi:hypothetical protein|nr:DUF4388 domain-containing protein [Thermoanaerobaculia bacterium]
MPAAVLEGSLASFKLPEVLTFLQTTRKSGRLALECDGRTAQVFLDAGSVVFAGSNQEDLRLGAILLRRKRISPEQRDRIDTLMREEGGRFGDLAVQQGAMTDAQLQDFLKVQVSEILYDAFFWSGGTFSFADELELPAHAVTITVDLANLIMEGARRIEEWEQCTRLLPDKNAVFRVVSRPSEDKVTLTVDEWRILFLINGKRTLEELASDAEDEPLQIYRVVYGLLANKLIEAVPATARTAVDDDTDGVSATRLVTAHGDATVRQAPANFGSESTVREAPGDDTSLLMASEARLLSYRDVVKPTVAQLTIANGAEQGSVIPLTEAEYLVGRQRENAIKLNDLGVSGRHARIFRGPDGYVIEDLKSRNGTWLNGARVFHAVLKNGDRLRLGETDFDYQVLYEATPSTATTSPA